MRVVARSTARNAQPAAVIDNAKSDGAIVQGPKPFIGLLQADRLAREHFADEEQTAFPLDLAVDADAANDVRIRIFRLAQSAAVTPWRTLIVPGRRRLLQGFVRTFFVVGHAECIEAMLLKASVCCRWIGRLALERQMHAFMPAILLRLAGFDAISQTQRLWLITEAANGVR